MGPLTIGREEETLEVFHAILSNCSDTVLDNTDSMTLKKSYKNKLSKYNLVTRFN